MQDDLLIWLTLGGAFVAAAMVVALAGSAVLKRYRLRARLAGNSLADGDAGTIGGGAFREWAQKLSRVDDQLIGLDNEGLRSKKRLELIRGGFFSPDAARNFVLVRVALTVLLPFIGYLFVAPFLVKPSLGNQYLVSLFFLAIGYFGPDLFLKHRQSALVEEYRIVFPDLLDLLVVCMDAGASVNAALERVGHDVAMQSRALSMNVELLVSEMRSGRSLVDALDSFTKRVGLEEAGSLSTLVKQSVELGTDVSDALRVYSDEMRDKRLSRAEAKAHALPVKITLPLGLCIFPSVLIVVLTPAIIRILVALHSVPR